MVSSLKKCYHTKSNLISKQEVCSLFNKSIEAASFLLIHFEGGWCTSQTLFDFLKWVKWGEKRMKHNIIIFCPLLCLPMFRVLKNAMYLGRHIGYISKDLSICRV